MRALAPLLEELVQETIGRGWRQELDLRAVGVTERHPLKALG
jgi:hypothetical protein